MLPRLRQFRTAAASGSHSELDPQDKDYRPDFLFRSEVLQFRRMLMGRKYCNRSNASALLCCNPTPIFALASPTAAASVCCEVNASGKMLTSTICSKKLLEDL
ncbi:hypothetical protein D918_09293 [Trichuris suis]|nr:hypothetical protein D918_09293 [Trichuris suis]